MKNPLNSLQLIEKACSVCGLTKSIDAYRKCSKAGSGYQSECKECAKVRNKKYYEENKNVLIEKQKVWNAKNPKAPKSQ